MKKYVHTIIIALSIMLAFLLGGCKPSRSVETQTAAVAVENIRLADSLHTDLSVQFDLLDYWVFDSISFDTCSRPVVKGAKHFALNNAEVKREITDVSIKQVADSTSIKAQEVIYPVRTPPKLPSWLVIVGIFFLLYIIAISRERGK